MDAYQGVERCVQEIERDIANKKESIAVGNFRSLEEYKYECGILRGMAAALDTLKSYAAQME